MEKVVPRVQGARVPVGPSVHIEVCPIVSLERNNDESSGTYSLNGENIVATQFMYFSVWILRQHFEHITTFLSACVFSP